MSAVANRYSQALFEAALDAGAVEKVDGDIRALQSLLEASGEFRGFVAHPLIPTPKREEVLKAMFSGKLQETTLGFLCLLARKERLDALPEILQALRRKVDAHQSLVTVRVVSADKLLVRQEKELEKKLADRLGKNVVLQTEVDPDLLGGFLIQIGDRIEDYSLATKLKLFKQHVINA